MNEFAAAKMVHVTAHIEYVEKAVWFHSPKTHEWSAEEAAKAKQALTDILEDLDVLSLSMTKLQCERLISEMDKMSLYRLGVNGAALRNTLVDELGQRSFFFIPQNDLRFYNQTELAGPGFKDRFPISNGELIEAGNCLAMGRYTACVCHLMRALDVVLAALERQMAIPTPDKGAERTWGKTLGRIRDEIAKNNKNPPQGWKKEGEFYQKAEAFIQAMKLTYRDSIFHVAAVYDEQSATSVFNATVEALRYLATRLAE
jgi:hypothetical protein